MSWMTQADAAVALGCSIRTIRRRIRSNSLSSRREGRNVLVELSLEDATTEQPLARCLPDGAFASPVVRPSENADTLTALAAAVQDNLSVLSECRQQLERNSGHLRRSGRTGWLLAFVAFVALGALCWFHYRKQLEQADNLHEVRQTFASREAESEQALAGAQARHAGEADALWVSMAHERLRVEHLEERNVGIVQQVGKLTAERDQALIDRQRLAAERDVLVVNLRNTEKAANLANTVRAMWAALKLVVPTWQSVEELHRLRAETRGAEDRHRGAMAAAHAQHEAELASAHGRYDGELEALRSSLDHERQTVAHMEQRIETLADKLVAVATDRGRLRLEQVQLKAEIDKLNADLRETQPAGDYEQLGQVAELP